MNKGQGNRTLWIDCYKTLAIILMVLGHTTGIFNRYIYQFHMAAFFFISGYCCHLNSESKIKVLWNRFYSLIFPLITIFIIGAILMCFQNYSGAYLYIWGKDYPYIGLKNILLQFFIKDANYVWWLGACWFIEVLFLVNLVQAILLFALNKIKVHTNILFITCTILLYLLGLMFAKKGIYYRNIDLVLIAQLYFGIGILFSKVMNTMKTFENKYRICIYVFFSIASFCLMFSLAKIDGIIIDYPAREFHHIILNFISSINGILFLYCISRLLESLAKYIKKISGICLYIGQNTIGVVFFHFLMFKVCYLFLMLLGVIDMAYLSNFTPTAPIGKSYCVLFLIVSICGSIFLWKLITLPTIGKTLLGLNLKFRDNCYDKFQHSHVKKFLQEILNRVITKVTLIGMDVKTKIQCTSANSKKYFVFASCYIILLLLPIVTQGITCNDELQARLQRMSGYFHLLKSEILKEIQMGRYLRILAPFHVALSFLTTNTYVNRIVQIGFLVLAIICFGMLIKEFFGEKKLSYITALLILVFLPITFEHSVPNAFNGLVCMPIVWLCISLKNWCIYLQKDSKKAFFISLICWVLALLGYEFIVTYTPVFLILYFLKRPANKKKLLDIINKTYCPCLMGFVYIVLTFLLQKLSSSVYAGVLIGFTSFRSSWNILKIINKSALPGYFLFNPKYQYLVLYLLPGEKFRELFMAISSGTKILGNLTVMRQLLEFVLKYTLTPRITILLISTVIIFNKVFSLYNAEKIKKSFKYNMFVLLFICIYTLIPILPNSIAEMYQTNVSENFFTSLPVSLLIFFTVCLFFAYLINALTSCYGSKKIVSVAMIGGILIIAIPVWTWNMIISTAQSQDFNRLTTIERLFDTECFKNMNNSTVYSNDIFESRDLLAVHDKYWNDYALLNGYTINFVHSGNEYDYKMFFVNDDYFTIIGNEEIAVLSDTKLANPFLIMTEDEQFVLVSSENYYYDNGFICYRFTKNDLSPIVDGEKAFIKEYRIAGNNLDSANIISGYYEDGWVEQTAQIQLYSGKSGHITLTGFYPSDLSEFDHVISISDGNTELCNYTLLENMFTISFDVNPEQIISLKISSNFTAENGEDIRDLSFILSSLEAE